MDRLGDSFYPSFVAMCRRLGCDPFDLLSVAANESGLNPAAWNAGGKAAGLWQMTPVAAPGMGWSPTDTQSFTRLTATQQLPHWERYYAPHVGMLTSAAACYLCTFMPALMAHAGEPLYVIAGWRGPFSWAYRGNRSFDHGNKGFVTVQDLGEAIGRACEALGDTWQSAALKLHNAMQPTVVVDVTNGGENRPLFIVPPPSGDSEPPKAA